MANYEKSSGVGGKWVDAEKIVEGTKCKLVAETKPRESAYKDENGNKKIQNVSKIVFATDPSEELNVNVNLPTINALVDAFGSDSNDWINKKLSAIPKDLVIAGKAVTALYLIPDGYKLTKDENKYLVIVKIGEDVKTVPLDPEMNDIKAEEIPF